jgi:hypothetical protein
VRDFIRTPAVAGRARTASQAPRAASRWPAGSAQLAPEPAARLGPAVPAYGSNLGLAYCTDKVCLLVPDTGHQRLCVPKTSSTLCNQAVFVDQATNSSLFLDAVVVEIDRFG